MNAMSHFFCVLVCASLIVRPLCASLMYLLNVHSLCASSMCILNVKCVLNILYLFVTSMLRASSMYVLDMRPHLQCVSTVCVLNVTCVLNMPH